MQIAQEVDDGDGWIRVCSCGTLRSYKKGRTFFPSPHAPALRPGRPAARSSTALNGDHRAQRGHVGRVRTAISKVVGKEGKLGQPPHDARRGGPRATVRRLAVARPSSATSCQLRSVRKRPNGPPA